MRVELVCSSKDIEAVVKKYRKLAREIEEDAPKGDLLHSVSKLGIFLENMMGRRAWRLEVLPPESPTHGGKGGE